jgi:hypothetical protein
LPGIGYVAGQYHRRGRQLGRVLATQYEEVVVDRLFAGNVQLISALQPLVEAAETTLGSLRPNEHARLSAWMPGWHAERPPLVACSWL